MTDRATISIVNNDTEYIFVLHKISAYSRKDGKLRIVLDGIGVAWEIDDPDGTKTLNLSDALSTFYHEDTTK